MPKFLNDIKTQNFKNELKKYLQVLFLILLQIYSDFFFSFDFLYTIWSDTNKIIIIIIITFQVTVCRMASIQFGRRRPNCITCPLTNRHARSLFAGGFHTVRPSPAELYNVPTYKPTCQITVCRRLSYSSALKLMLLY